MVMWRGQFETKWCGGDFGVRSTAYLSGLSRNRVELDAARVNSCPSRPRGIYGQAFRLAGSN
jgi:hypothetical protein